MPERPKSSAQKSVEDLLPDIIALLRTNTVHDFTLYKHGTLERRVERRMALAGVKTAARYLDLLLRDATERDQRQYSIARRAELAQSEQADPRSVADARNLGRNRRGP